MKTLQKSEAIKFALKKMPQPHARWQAERMAYLIGMHTDELAAVSVTGSFQDYKTGGFIDTTVTKYIHRLKSEMASYWRGGGVLDYLEGRGLCTFQQDGSTEWVHFFHEGVLASDNYPVGRTEERGLGGSAGCTEGKA